MRHTDGTGDPREIAASAASRHFRASQRDCDLVLVRQIIIGSELRSNMAAPVKRAKTEHANLLFARGSAGPFVQLSRSIIEVWSCLDQRSWGRFSVVSKWMNWSARFPGHGVHAQWFGDRPPGRSVVAQNALKSVYCNKVRHSVPTRRAYNSGCAAVARVLGRCSALQKLTIRLTHKEAREIDNANLAPLSRLVQLRELRITNGDALFGLKSLTTMSCLEVLELKPVDVAKLPVLASVRDLRVEPLKKKITEKTAQRLAWPSLTALTVEDGLLSAEAMRWLTRNGKLRRLEAVSFHMVEPAPALVHVTLQGWSSVRPPSASLFHKDLTHLAVCHRWGIKGPWCLHAPFMAAPCPASLQSLQLGCAQGRETKTWAFAQWVTGTSRTSLRAMDLDTLYHMWFPECGSWLQGLRGLKRLQIGDLPEDVRLPQLHELSIRSYGYTSVADQVRKLPLWVPELRVLWLYSTTLAFDGHLLALMPQLRCLFLTETAGSEKTRIWKILDEMLGCTCDCPETLVHMPKLRILRTVWVPRSDEQPRWLLKAKAQNIVVTDNKEDWSLDHSVYTE